jgi:hypothetical protein
MCDRSLATAILFEQYIVILTLEHVCEAFTQRRQGPRTPKSTRSTSRLRRKCPEPVMTHFVMPFRQNRATSALFFTGGKSAARGSLQQLDKTMVICKGAAS